MIAQEEEAGIQSTQKEFNFMAAVGAYEETERANTNSTLKNNLQEASTSGTQSDKAPFYDLDESAELLEPIPKPQQRTQNNSNVISEVSSVEQGRGIVEQHPETVEETRAYQESIFHNIVAKKVNSVNHKMKETNAESTTELARYKNQEKARLFDKVSKQKDSTKGTSVNTLFCEQSIMGKTASSGSKLYSITPFLKSSVLPKVDKANALSKPVTSNSAPSTRDSKGVQTVNVIAFRIFRTNPSNTSRVDNVIPMKPVKASVKTKLLKTKIRIF
uniref:Uncharacterized protein n=1 Tax=Tanacetum cinerariifolium TaxID=118510 RepID=A0A6L2JUH1_TANCI|nr:hypothetical protein [Tanacetum cinerariifolium]